jgi:hypothetical protein
MGARKSQISVPQILAWADAHFERSGCFPESKSGIVREAPDATWKTIDQCLRKGNRGLAGGLSLAKLLAEYRGKRNRKALPTYTTAGILAWADAYHLTTGDWPLADSGSIDGAPGETWLAVDSALYSGIRGLSGRSSLAQLLAEQRGKPNRSARPSLSIDQILAWADAKHARTGKWPGHISGPIPEAPGETWAAVQMALSQGLRGLPGGSSLAQLFAERRGVRNRMALPRFSLRKILTWADLHRRRHGRWPKANSGSIADATGETWAKVNSALNRGTRGLPDGWSLARLLAERRGARNHLGLPAHSIEQILAWADSHRARTGRWPRSSSGPIMDAAGETWSAVNHSLVHGDRGLRGGSSLARLLTRRRGAPHRLKPARLALHRILAWADAHHRRTGAWPTARIGRVADVPGENWGTINEALRRGTRGLDGGSSLATLLARHRGVDFRRRRPDLSLDDILKWADAYFVEHRAWPTENSGEIDKEGATWANVDSALRVGRRGLPGGSSLPRLLAERRGARNSTNRPRLNRRSILAWADKHRRRTGRWPMCESGPVVDATGETWNAVNSALVLGLRGLKGGSSLAKLLDQYRRLS